MIVTELSKGTKLYLLVGGRGTRLSSVTNGKAKPLVNVKMTREQLTKMFCKEKIKIRHGVGVIGCH